MNPLKKLSRLFRGNPNNNFLAELYSKTSKPLFVHPQVGKAMLDSYLVMAKQNVDLMGQERDSGSGSSVYISQVDGVAVMDITGSLTDREMSVPCMASPVSYEAIKFEMQELLADQEVHTIVARLDTPGGVASQNMDLSDFIYASRGQGTKLIASVDDMAYSAGFGIASAFEEIWITRTGGVGSVGVVSYHEDHSEELSRKGVNIEYIYAGDKKVFGNPTEPLSDDARGEFQLEVSRLYNLFTATIARNLNLSVDVVKATQAGTFHGQDAVDAGFAHRLGTFDELMQELFNVTESKLESDDTDVSLETDVPVVKLENNQEDLDKIQEQEALNTYTASLKALCIVAGVESSVADTYIQAKMSIDEVRDNLLIITDNSNKQIVTGKPLDKVDNKQEQIDNGWDNAFSNK